MSEYDCDDVVEIWFNMAELNALKNALKPKGLKLENEFALHFQQLYTQHVDEQTRQHISGRIAEAREENRLAAAAAHRFVTVKITEKGATCFAEISQVNFHKPHENFQLSRIAGTLRHYLREEVTSESFLKLLVPYSGELVEISQEQHDRNVLSIGDESNPHCTFALEIDFDRQIIGQTFGSGWQHYNMKDVSTAAYFTFQNNLGATGNKYTDSKFYSRLEGKELAAVAQEAPMHGINEVT